MSAASSDEDEGAERSVADRAISEGAAEDAPTAAAVVDESGRAAVGSSEDRALTAATRRTKDQAVRGRTALRSTYGTWILVGAAVQVVIADVGFFCYAISNSWQISDRAIVGWLTATVLEVIAAVVVVGRELFRADDG